MPSKSPVRARAAETLTRGSIQANLTVDRSGAQPVVRVNAAVLEAVLATMKQTCTETRNITAVA